MTDVALWWIALGLGLVVLLVALVLLQVFLNEVRKIEHNAARIWQAGKDVAANTAATWQLEALSRNLDALQQEARQHTHLLRGDGDRR
jgi:hypothetical protein